MSDISEIERWRVKKNSILWDQKGDEMKWERKNWHFFMSDLIWEIRELKMILEFERDLYLRKLGKHSLILV